SVWGECPGGPKRPRGFRCQSVPLSKTVPLLLATHPVPIIVGGAIGYCATSSLLHLPIGNAVTGGDQRFHIENRGQPLPMLQPLDPQLLQRLLRIARHEILVQLDGCQLVMPVGRNFFRNIHSFQHIRPTTASLPFTFLAAWALVKK